jgi:hypothetical protein
MRLLNALRLLVDPNPPAVFYQGSVYFDSTVNEPRYYDGANWSSFGTGVPDPVISYTVPAGRQVMYFDHITNNGVLSIEDTGYLVGTR